MKLYLLRHGIAEEHGPDKPDPDRRLTDEGVAEMRSEAGALRKLGLKLDIIVTSPYDRALQTAEIVADALEMKDRLEVDQRLAAGCRLGDLQEILGSRSGIQRLMIVGHNPDLPSMAGQLAGGAAIDLKKGGLIRLDVDRIEPGAGILEWVLTPGVLLK
jgi:phosphohistidine phosphatase